MQRGAALENYVGSDRYGWGYLANRAMWHNKGKSRSYGELFREGDTISVHLDCDQGTLWFGRNGRDLGVAVEGLSGELYPAVSLYNKGDSVTFVAPDVVLAARLGADLPYSPLGLSPPNGPEKPLRMAGTAEAESVVAGVAGVLDLYDSVSGAEIGGRARGAMCAAIAARWVRGAVVLGELPEGLEIAPLIASSGSERNAALALWLESEVGGIAPAALLDGTVPHEIGGRGALLLLIADQATKTAPLIDFGRGGGGRRSILAARDAILPSRRRSIAARLIRCSASGVGPESGPMLDFTPGPVGLREFGAQLKRLSPADLRRGGATLTEDGSFLARYGAGEGSVVIFRDVLRSAVLFWVGRDLLGPPWFGCLPDCRVRYNIPAFRAPQ